MVSAFMRGVKRLRPARPMAVPSWDLSVILEGLVAAHFEPLESAPERILTLKVTLLLALTSLKRVGDLQALSVRDFLQSITGLQSTANHSVYKKMTLPGCSVLSMIG